MCPLGMLIVHRDTSLELLKTEVKDCGIMPYELKSLDIRVTIFTKIFSVRLVYFSRVCVVILILLIFFFPLFTCHSLLSKDGHKDWIFSIAWINDTMAVSGKIALL